MAAGGGAPWAERARFVGSQIRNRFRVAPVDRRWLWRRADRSVATEAVRRWSDRVRALLQRDRGADHGSSSTGMSAGAAAKPSPSALRFYRKKGNYNGDFASILFQMGHSDAMSLIL
jgi:monolysocardiolipin acyltransferase